MGPLESCWVSEKDKLNLKEKNAPQIGEALNVFTTE
jgi:hypothetical protein